MHRPSPPSDSDQHADRRRPPTPPPSRPDQAQTSKPLATHHDLINNYPSHRPRLKPPPLKRTSPLAWFAAICCAFLWTIIILGGLAVLIIYLLFRPRNPHLDIPQATLNAAYLDIDIDSNTTLLNADLTLLANFSNPNHKVDVVFTLLDLDLYFGATLVAAAALNPFAERRGESALRSVHMVASQVALPEKEAEEWRRQEEEGAAGSGGGNGLMMEVRGTMRTRSELGGLLRFSYWLHCRCGIVMGAPPGGALKNVSCRTKR
ncbi:hypothetical protein KFK09_010917 [Dendrobium nobile]|uniref:Late embryogenesis abundant protein LEA-2 subgroup domain-containing protein n=1 Tax=Dendrobium nobile TaxID=94219 RepID=A0A8T3BBD4_DENNO|nr:hypothetical protein KFK09_010917 [Dendrobium nobile]